MNATSKSAPAVVITGLTKQFRRAEAIHDLTLEIPRGTVFGLIGPNGAGKSTTMKILMGLLRPSSGTTSVLGLDPLVDPVAIRQRVGYVPEAHHAYRWMRVEQVIGFCRAQHHSWNPATCDAMLKLFELDPLQKVKHLSKGMLVKLSLLLAVSHDPELLILDEPMAGLDPIAREEFLDGVLRTICERQQTVLFSTHILDDVQRLADTVGILYRGRMLVHQPIDELLASTKQIRATLAEQGKPGPLPDDLVWQRVNGREWIVTVRNFTPAKLQEIRDQSGVDHVDVVDLGLEDLFKDIIRGQRVAS